MKELACRAGGISGAERVILEEGSAARYPLGWSEKINLAYQAGKELNKCHFLGYAIELVVTNNWQAAKPNPWFEIDPVDKAVLAKLPASEEPLDGGAKEGGEGGEGKGAVIDKEAAVPEVNKQTQNPEDDVGKELLNVPFEILTMKMELSLHAGRAAQH